MRVPAWQMIYVRLIDLFTISALIIPFMGLAVSVNNPDTKLIPISVILTEPNQASLWIRILFGLHLTWILYVFWAMTLGYMVISFLPVFSSIFLITEIRLEFLTKYEQTI